MDLLCFHGDSIEVNGQSSYPVTADHVYMDGDEVGLKDGSDYDRIWAGRIVNSDDVCDCWAEMPAVESVNLHGGNE